MASIKIGSPVSRSNPTSVFVVTAETMSGDADAYDYPTKHFPADKMDDLLAFCTTLHSVLALGNNNNCGGPRGASYADGAIIAAATAAGADPADWLESYQDFMPGDVTCDGQWPQTLCDFKVNYFDDAGVEHVTTVTVFGREFKCEAFD